MIWNKKNVSDLIKKQTGILKRDFKLSPITTVHRPIETEFFVELTLVKTEQRYIVSYVNDALTLEEL